MNIERSKTWWRAFRFHYSSASFMPGILGTMIAWTTDGEFHAGYFLLVMLGLVLNHLALNMTDDYYDFRHLVDVFAGDNENPYTGGSGTLSSGLIQPDEMRRVFTAFYVVAIGIDFFSDSQGVFLSWFFWLSASSAPFSTRPRRSNSATGGSGRWRNSSVSVRQSGWAPTLSRPREFPGRPSGEPFLLESCCFR